MKTLFIFLPIRDYIKTRRKLWRQYLIPLAAGIIVVIGAFAIDVRDGIDIEAIFSDFVGIQISGIATLVSFLLAIITILVSSDNENIRKLKSEKSSEIHYKKLGNEQLRLFQVLLSNISYYVMVEIIYMIILIVYVFLALIVPTSAIKWLISISVFFLMHILLGMMECVTQMYLTFWKDKR